jgi:hypothetical protein
MVAKDAIDGPVAAAFSALGCKVDVIPAFEQAHRHNDDNPQGVKKINILQH